MADFRIISVWDEPYYFFCQIGALSFTCLRCYIHYSLPPPIAVDWFAYALGNLYTSLVGLLNMILVIQTWEKIEACSCQN